MKRWQAILFVSIGAICYGSLSTMTKLSFAQGFSPAEVSGSLVFVGCFILWICTIPSFKQLFSMPLKAVMMLLLVGVILGFTEVFYTLSLKKISASLAVILLFQFTWMSQCVQMIQQKSLLTKWRILSLIIILFGTYFASGLQNFDDHVHIGGVILGLLSAVSYTASIYICGSVGVQYHSLIRSTLMVTGQLIFVFCVFPPTFLISGALFEGLWIWALLLGVFGIVITTFLFNIAIPYIGTGLSGILGSIELPVVLLLASWILQEQVTMMQWFGAVLILLGILIADIRVVKTVSKKKISTGMTNQ